MLDAAARAVKQSIARPVRKAALVSTMSSRTSHDTARRTALHPGRTQEKTMLMKKTLIATMLMSGALLAVHAPVRAAELDDWQLMMSHKMMDKNHDGMVSKKEFMDMMDKAYDMKAKDMKADTKGMTDAQLRAFLKSLYIN
jgi:hypothetical protein